MKIAFLFLVFCVGESASSVITSSPGLKRTHIGDNCEFQWTVSGELTSYKILNMSTGTSTGLSTDHSNHSRVITTTSSSSLIRLFIWNIHLWDAGNYSLSVTQGATTTINAGALLFVYDNAATSAVTQNGTPPAIEGLSVALTCTVTTRSRPSNPPSIRPPVHYFWRLGSYENLGNITRGHPKKSNGEILTRYNITNDGRNLVISPVESSDRQSYSCWGWEEGARLTTATSPALQLAVNYRPIINKRQPRSGRFNGDISQTVTFSFDFDANPEVVTAPTWALTNSLGVSETLPPQFESLNFSKPFTISFSLSSVTYYGRYTFSVGNSVGTASDSFSVERPGRPDAPSHLTVLYKTFRLLSIEWKCQWFNGRRQTTMLRLKDLETTEFIDAFNQTETDQSCYNSSRDHLFQNHLQADRDYEVSLWSTNSLGSSDVIRTTVRTTKRFQLILSHKTISIEANVATINFETMYGSMALLNVNCCAEETGVCKALQFQVNASSTQVTMTGLPAAGSVYLFDFTAFGKTAKGLYYLGMIRGVKVHRDGNPSDPLLTAVIVLGVLLGVACLCLIGCLVAFVRYRLRLRREAKGMSTEGLTMNSDLNELKPRKTEEKEQQRAAKEQQKPAKRPLPALKFRSKAQDPPPKIPSPDEDTAQETYEAMDRQDEGETYTPLDQPPPPSRTKKALQQRNYYS